MRKRLLAATGAGLLAAGLFASPAQAQSAGTSKVSVLHGVPGLTVDVYANGGELVPDFKPGTLAGPLDLPAGSYDLQVFKDNEGPSGTPAIEAKGVQVPGGANLTVVAYLNEAGTPSLKPFVNDTSATAAGQARLTVRHVAQAPAVDVRAGGTPVISGLKNPDEKVLNLPAGAVAGVDVVPAGTPTPVLGPTDLDLKEGTNTIVYAWGAVGPPSSLALAVQTVSGLHSAPYGVPAGQTGAAGQSVPWLLILAGTGLAGALVTGRRLTAARATRG